VGLILDTSILIESERRGEAIEDILQRVRARMARSTSRSLLSASLN
jgi:hypothetical protein